MTNRRKFLAQSGMAATALLAANPFKSFAKAGSLLSISNDRIVLLHSGSLHSAAGFGLLKDAVSDSRAGLDNLFLLDTGSHTSNAEQAAQLTQQLQKLKYDVALPGDTHLSEEAAGNNIPLVISNFPISNAHQQKNIHPFQVIRKGKYTIGVIGAAKTNDTSGLAAEISTLAGRLKAEGCQLVVCLSSLGAKPDVLLARQTRNLDVIIGTTGLKCAQPEIAKNADQHDVVINHTSAEGVMIGKIEFMFDDEGNKKGIAFANLHRADSSTRWTKFKMA